MPVLDWSLDWSFDWSEVGEVGSAQPPDPKIPAN